MLKNPFVRYFKVTNDLEDFKMPYQIYGKNDLEIMLDKYNRLTNKPKTYLHVRFTNGKASL
jgi:hypothetical protein